MGETLVDTRAGKLRGLTQDGIHRFAGVPYGAPTGGERRFLPPCRRHRGAACATRRSSAHLPAAAGRWSTGPADANVTGAVRYLPQSEDCLVLNVWTPALRDGRRRPVMVWLHGRGFMGARAPSPGTTARSSRAAATR